jgi:biopolymer transport protein TolQ
MFANIGAFMKAYAHSDLFGKIVILGLVALSAICWIVLIHKVWVTRRVMKLSQEFRRAFLSSKEQLLNLDLTKLPKASHSGIPHPYAAIFDDLKRKAVEILNKNHFFSSQAGKEAAVYLSPVDLEMIEAHTLSAISASVKKLEQNLFVLPTIITLAPFLGLLGTVWGILVTFGELGGGTATSNMAILGGLSTALATTVLGLIIAIPALVAYNYLKSTIRHYTSDMEEFLYELLSAVEIQYRKVEM